MAICMHKYLDTAKNMKCVQIESTVYVSKCINVIKIHKILVVFSPTRFAFIKQCAQTNALQCTIDWTVDINLLAATRAALFIAECYAFLRESFINFICSFFFTESTLTLRSSYFVMFYGNWKSLMARFWYKKRVLLDGEK